MSHLPASRPQHGRGWLPALRHLPSPNHDRRPAGCIVDLLVIHGISLPAGEFGNGCIDRLFCNCLPLGRHPDFATLAGVRVSAHLLVDRRGGLTQYVPLHRRAWHAGTSCWQGRAHCNDYSIGIELEGTDHLPYTDAQYHALAALTRRLLRLLPTLCPARIVGHSDVAPGRKTDPGPAFDRRRYRRLVASGS